jgi:FtsZ-binding cell division protein ZapB
MTSHLTDTEDLVKRLRARVSQLYDTAMKKTAGEVLSAVAAIETLTKERDEAQEARRREHVLHVENVSSLTAENERLKAQQAGWINAGHSQGLKIATLSEQLAEARKALEEVVGCFEAARVEGLNDRLAELADNDVGSLHDLYARRLSFAEMAALAALPPETTGEKR